MKPPGRNKDTMRRVITATALAVFCAACTNSVAVRHDQEIVNSMNYDEIPCRTLADQRDALAARHGLARDARREAQQESNTAGFGIFIPDARSEATREKARAASEIGAMNRSMERRRCGQA